MYTITRLPQLPLLLDCNFSNRPRPLDLQFGHPARMPMMLFLVSKIAYGVSITEIRPNLSQKNKPDARPLKTLNPSLTFIPFQRPPLQMGFHRKERKENKKKDGREIREADLQCTCADTGNVREGLNGGLRRACSSASLVSPYIGDLVSRRTRFPASASVDLIRLLVLVLWLPLALLPETLLQGLRCHCLST